MLEVSQPASPSPAANGCAWAYLRATMRNTNTSIADLRIVNLYVGHCGRYGNGRRYLGNGEQISPEERSTDDLLRNDDHIARLQASGEDIRPIPFPGASSNDRTIGTNYKNLFAIRNIVGSTSPAQVPSRFFAGNISKGRGVINLAADQHEPGAFGDSQHVAGMHLDVGRRVRPAVDIRA